MKKAGKYSLEWALNLRNKKKTKKVKLTKRQWMNFKIKHDWLVDLSDRNEAYFAGIKVYV